MKNTQISSYFGENKPKAHHKELVSLIETSIQSFDVELLDIGCAAGSFLELVASKFPKVKLTGFDVSNELIQIAQSKNKLANANLFQADLLKLCLPKKFDIICASGVMSIFENFEDPIEQWANWLKPNGVLFIFGRFNTADIDTKIKFRNNYSSGEWEDGLSSYSCNTVSKFCRELGLESKFKRFYLPFEIPKQKDPIKTYTKVTVEGEKLIVNGANIIAEHFHLIIRRSK